MSAGSGHHRNSAVAGRLAAALVMAAALGVAALRGHGQELSAERRLLAFAAPPSSVRLSPDGRELLVEFERPLADGEAGRAAKSLGPLLEGYAEGYGAVRFRLAQPVSAELRARMVELQPRDAPEPSLDDERRLALAEARLQAQEGGVAGARIRLRQIAAERPDDVEPALALAEVEAGAGRWQHAVGLYDGVLRLFPEATDVAADRDALAFRRGPSTRLDLGATFGPNGERTQTGTLQADLPFAELWRAGLSLQTSHDSIRGLRQSGSAVAADYDGTKLFGTVSLAHDWQSPTDTTRLSLFAAPRTTGFGLGHELATSLGQTSLAALYHQPYWGTVMSFAANARRDQLGVAQTFALPDRWRLQLGAGLVRYGIPGNDSVASGPSAVAGVSRLLPERWMPLAGMQLRVGYRLEAEYLSHVASGPTASGPMPLLDVRAREVHSLYTETSVPIGPGSATGLLGYALDRYGGGGPQALLRYTAGEDGDRFAVSAEAGLEPSLDLRPRTLFHIGGYAVWRFGSS